MRLPYAPRTPPPASSPSTTTAYTHLSARRSPAPLLDLDLTLLHSPPVAAGWSSFFGAIRTQTTLSAAIRELCICRIAVLNGAEYEWMQHVPLLREAGVGERAVQEIQRRKAWRGWGGGGLDKAGAEGEGEGGEDDYGGLNEEQRAVLAYTDAMTVGVKVSEEIFAEVRRRFDERGVVEITATVAGYNCVSRFLVALDVGEVGEGKKVE